jgi:hypothetical protein
LVGVAGLAGDSQCETDTLDGSGLTTVQRPSSSVTSKPSVHVTTSSAAATGAAVTVAVASPAASTATAVTAAEKRLGINMSFLRVGGSRRGLRVGPATSSSLRASTQQRVTRTTAARSVSAHTCEVKGQFLFASGC